MGKNGKKIDIYLKQNKFFKGAKLTPDQSNRLVTGMLLIENDLCEKDQVLPFCTMSIDVGKCQ